MVETVAASAFEHLGERFVVIRRLQSQVLAHLANDCTTWSFSELVIGRGPCARSGRAPRAGSLLPTGGSFELLGCIPTEVRFGLCSFEQVASNIAHEGARVGASGDRRLRDAADSINLFDVEVRAFRQAALSAAILN